MIRKLNLLFTVSLFALLLGCNFPSTPSPTPDLFASGALATVQLFVVNRNGKGLQQVSNLPAVRGRSDWSPDGQFLVT
jgi:hypothetical protein